MPSTLMYDAIRGEEVTFSYGTMEIIEMTDSEGNEVENTDWDRPGYDVYDTDEFTETVEETEDYQDSLRDDSDTSIGIPGGDDIPDFGTGS
ncbi:hypothetical protein, partial [Natrialba chahannaoensis]